MANNVFVKKGESLRDIKKPGMLFRNILIAEKMEANVTHILPGCKTQGFAHRGQEIKFVVKGQVDYHVGDDVFRMEEGDVLFHHSEDKHWAKNTGTKEAIFVTISTPPTFTLFHSDK